MILGLWLVFCGEGASLPSSLFLVWEVLSFFIHCLEEGDETNEELRKSFPYFVLFVGLSYYMTNEELRKAFSKFGNVTEARLVMDQRTQRPKGFGFVTFESEMEAQRALKAMDGRIHNGRLIFVEFAKPIPPEEEAPR